MHKHLPLCALLECLASLTKLIPHTVKYFCPQQVPLSQNMGNCLLQCALEQP